MIFKQIGDFNGNLIETILKNRGIENTELFLNPVEESTDPYSIYNMEKAVNMVIGAINNNEKVLICVDSDMDGYSSATIIYKYLKKCNLYLDYFVHRYKEHGLTNDLMDYIELTEPDLIIVPDAGSNDIENIEKLTNIDKKVLIIDHHIIDKKIEENRNYIIVNNQHENNAHINSNYTGAGMTYLFCLALDKYFGFGTEQFKDLATIGIIGDGANVLNNEIRYFCLDGIKNINNNLIKTLYDMNGKDVDNLYFEDLSFGGIIPAVNATIRIGELEDKKLLFETLADINTDYTEIVEKRKLNKETRKYEKIKFEYDAYQLMVDLAAKLKSKQDSIAKKFIKKSIDQFNNETGIQIFKIDTVEEKMVTGLLANKLVNEYRQPVIVVWENEENYSGSLRGYEKTMSSFKKWCEDTKLFDMVQGHENAAGISFKKENLQKIIEKSKNIEAEEICYNVDLIYSEKVKIDHIFEIWKYYDLFKNGCNKPLFAVKQITTKKQNIMLNKKTMKFYIDKVSYLKFQTSEDEYNNIARVGFDEDVTFNLIVSFDVNEWNGNLYPQAIIKDYEIVKKEENKYGIFG